MSSLRRSFLAALACAVVLGPTLPAMSASPEHLIFLGTYTKNGSHGIYTVRLDSATGALSTPALVAESPDPAWITFSPDKKFLYTIYPSQAQAAGYRVSVTPASVTLTPLPTSPATAAAAQPPSHLAVDATGRTLLAANYREGFVAAIPISPDGSLGTPNITKHSGKGTDPKRQEAPHVHSVTISPDNRYVAVCDLGLDQVFSYAIDASAAKLTPAATPSASVPPGFGPRHFKFSHDGRHAYAITEMGGTVEAFNYEAATGKLTPLQSISSLPADFNGLKWGAEVRVHPNGKFLYASNRTHDSIAVFTIATDGRLTLVETVPSGGKTPRNFALSPDGGWLVCGHQDSPELTVFRVDPKTGRLAATAHRATVPMCVCVLFYN
jgi:6-phosphogluconolactonase